MSGTVFKGREGTFSRRENDGQADETTDRFPAGTDGLDVWRGERKIFQGDYHLLQEVLLLSTPSIPLLTLTSICHCIAICLLKVASQRWLFGWNLGCMIIKTVNPKILKGLVVVRGRLEVHLECMIKAACF